MRKKPTSLEIEGILEDALEAEQQADCEQDYSSTGMCPCCGAEVYESAEEKWLGKYHNILVTETQQVCPSCEWKSVYLNDL